MDRRAVADRHAPVLEALRSRDEERVVAALERHFVQAAEALAGRWTDPDPGAAD
jgi:DNA-binding GntR family transcriptional regulator